MNTIRLKIQIEAFDCYIYSGHLFLFLKDGTIGCINFNSIYHNLYIEYPAFVDFFRLVFQRNDYFKNKQGLSIFNIPEIKKSFKNTWAKISKDVEFEYYNFDDFQILSKIPEKDLPILDVKIYGMKIFVATINGVYSMNLTLNKNNEFAKVKHIQKRFDSKSIYLNAKCGSLAISTNNDGLFHASIYGSDVLKVNEKQVSNKSIRTSWVNYDLINYETNQDFEFIENKIERKNSESEYSFRDEQMEKNVISNFGINKISNEQLIKGLNFKDETIKYAFNSSKSVFLITSKGNFYNSNILIENSFNEFLELMGVDSSDKASNKEVRLSSRCITLPKVKNKKLLKPLSSHILNKGCVLEFMDKVVLFKDNKTQIIDNNPSINLRTYPHSLRYQNLLTDIKLKDVIIHSIYPF